jgi:hypothetical protein
MIPSKSAEKAKMLQRPKEQEGPGAAAALAPSRVDSKRGALRSARSLLHGVEFFPESIAEWLDRHRWLFLCLFSVVYFAGTGFHASRRPLWADEVLTAWMTRLNLRDLWSALGVGADIEPPLFHLITRAFTGLFGESLLALRLPSILGGWMMCVGLFAFISRRGRTLYAAVAMLIPFVTAIEYYMGEARCYGIALGFCGPALICWQSAIGGGRRKVALVGLALSLAAAVSCHYYLVLMIAAIAAGELVRSFTLKHVDAPTWIALAAGLVPLPLHLPLIRAAMTFHGAAWSAAGLSGLHFTYQALLAPAILPAIVVITGLTLYRAYHGSDTKQVIAPAVNLSAAELTTALVLTCGLAAALVLAKITNGIFTLRYGLCTVFGFAIVPALLLSWFDRHRPIAGSIAFFVLSGLFVSTEVLKNDNQDAANYPFPADGSQAIVLQHPLRFMEMVYNAPPAVVSRLYYLASPSDAVRYAGQNADDDRGLLLLKKWLPLQVEDPQRFLDEHKRFLLWQTRGGSILSRLLDSGATITLNKYVGGQSLFLVETNSAIPPGELK